MLVFLIILFVFFFFMAIYTGLEERKKKKLEEAGLCSVCGKVNATKKLPEGGSVCDECYDKIAPGQIERRRRMEERPVNIKAECGTCSIDRYGSFYKGSPDRAGGWDVCLTVSNNTDKTINYVYVELLPYNTVGDVGYSPTVGAGPKVVTITGPIRAYSKLKNQVAKKFWYDIPIARLGIGTVQVIFADGTEKTFKY